MDVEERRGIAGPAHADGRGPDHVFQDQVPADDPGHELAHRRVGVGVGGARHRDHRGEFGVAKRRRRHTRSRPSRRTGRRPARSSRAAAPTGQHEDAGADDGADAEHDQVEGAQRALERNRGRDARRRLWSRSTDFVARGGCPFSSSYFEFSRIVGSSRGRALAVLGLNPYWIVWWRKALRPA